MRVKTREELRSELLEGMCWAAEGGNNCFYEPSRKYGEKTFDRITGQEIIFGVASRTFVGNLPLAFKPSVADKFLFNKIIDKVIESIDPKKVVDEKNKGTNLLTFFYWPYYGWCDEMELERNKKE